MAKDDDDTYALVYLCYAMLITKGLFYVSKQMAAREELFQTQMSLARECQSGSAVSAKSADREHRERCKAEAEIQVNNILIACLCLLSYDWWSN